MQRPLAADQAATVMPKKRKKQRARKTKKRATPARAAARGAAPFEWRASLACIATYRVLEDNDKLDQFEEADLPFDSAPDQLLSELRYFPKTTNNRDIIKVLSFEIARKFLNLLVRNFTVKKENEQLESADILRALAAQFGARDTTIKSLAATVDELIRFGDEGTP